MFVHVNFNILFSSHFRVSRNYSNKPVLRTHDKLLPKVLHVSRMILRSFSISETKVALSTTPFTFPPNLRMDINLISVANKFRSAAKGKRSRKALPFPIFNSTGANLSDKIAGADKQRQSRIKAWQWKVSRNPLFSFLSSSSFSSRRFFCMKIRSSNGGTFCSRLTKNPRDSTSNCRLQCFRFRA